MDPHFRVRGLVCEGETCRGRKGELGTRKLSASSRAGLEVGSGCHSISEEERPMVAAQTAFSASSWVRELCICMNSRVDSN